MGVLFKPTDSIISLEEDDFNELKNRVYSYFGWPNVAIELENDSSCIDGNTNINKIYYETVIRQ